MEVTCQLSLFSNLTLFPLFSAFVVCVNFAGNHSPLLDAFIARKHRQACQLYTTFSYLRSPMARSKTATEKTPRDDGDKQANGVSHQLDGAVHSLEKKIQEEARNPREQKEAGLGQLVICVGGIYASLYTSSPPTIQITPNNSTASAGPTSKSASPPRPTAPPKRASNTPSS